MTKVKDLTIDELEYLIEQKILEVLGDPDSGLELGNAKVKMKNVKMDKR